MSARSPITHVTIVSVASEAGTHWSGQSRAPSALLNHGLSSKLFPHCFLSFLNALTSPILYSPQPLINGVRNEDAVLKVMHSVKATISSLDNSTISLVLGGDCSITPAILSALCNRQNKRIGILYFDGDVDLSLPATSQETADSDVSVLDSMVFSNLTRWLGSLAKNGFKAFGAPTVQKDPKAVVKEALTWLEDRCDCIFVHFDVDVINSTEFQLGKFPYYAGLASEDAIAALEVFVGSEKLVGLVITEVNPGNDGSVEMVERLVDGIVGAFRNKA